MVQPRTVEQIVAITDEPVIAVNELGLIDFINDIFTAEYGWTKKDLLGQPLTLIIPHHFRDTHRLGFSRFLSTEKKTLIGQPLPLPILLKDNSISQAEHFIVAEKSDNKWRFAATITRLQPKEL